MTITLLRQWESVEDAISAVAMLGAHYPLTETSGTSIRDVGQYARHGTLSGTVTLNNLTAPDGRPAALFGGGHVEIADATAWSINANLGLSAGALVKFANVPSVTRYIITKGTTSQYEWGFYAGNPGALTTTAWVLTGATLSGRSTTVTPVGDTNWHLVITKIQNRSALTQIDMFADGSLLSMNAPSSTGSPYSDGTSPVRIGARGDGSGNPMDGYIRNAFLTPEAIHIGSIKRIAAACRREGWF